MPISCWAGSTRRSSWAAPSRSTFPAPAPAVERDVAVPLGLSIEDAAEGLLTLTNASLAAAIRLSLFEKGLDPRDFALLSFGGAGGLHAIPVAEELGVDRVVFPADASTFSASGILHSDIVHDLAASRLMRARPENLPDLVALLDDLRRAGHALLDADGVPGEAREIGVSADMRYGGQAFELVVPWEVATLDPATLDTLVARFHAVHEQRFSYANPGDPVEIVTLRVTATGKLPAIAAAEGAAVPVSRDSLGRRPMVLAGAWQDVDVYRRAALGGTGRGSGVDRGGLHDRVRGGGLDLRTATDRGPPGPARPCEPVRKLPPSSS